MDIFKATITIHRPLPAATSVHDRYFLRSEDAIQSFKNLMALESGVSIIAKTEEVYDKRFAMKNGKRIAEMRVLKIPVYDAPRLDLSF